MGFLDEQARALKPFLKEVAKEEYAKVHAVKFSATYECLYNIVAARIMWKGFLYWGFIGGIW